MKRKRRPTSRVPLNKTHLMQ